MYAGFDVLGYQRGYDAWRLMAADAGYAANFRSVDVLTTLALATSGDTGTAVVRNFFNPPAADAGNPLLNTGAPSFKEGGNVPSSSIFGIYALWMQISVQLGTITQMNTLLAALMGGKVTANIGNQPFVDWCVNRIFQSSDGGWAVSNDAAATPLVARSNFMRSSMQALPAPKILDPGAQLSAKLTYSAASIPVATNVTLAFHMFAADQGSN